jgi:hypothetical protein
MRNEKTSTSTSATANKTNVQEKSRCRQEEFEKDVRQGGHKIKTMITTNKTQTNTAGELLEVLVSVTSL